MCIIYHKLANDKTPKLREKLFLVIFYFFKKGEATQEKINFAIKLQ